MLDSIYKVEASRRLNTIEEPRVIISASGIIGGGRIKYHVINSITDEKIS